MRLGTLDVERKGALAGEAEVTSCTCLELIRFVALTDRAGELERLQVVVSEDIRQVLHALARLPLDPGGGGPVAGGACTESGTSSTGAGSPRSVSRRTNSSA